MCAGGEKILRKRPSSFPGQVPGELRVLHPGAFPGIPAGAKHELRKGERRRAGRAGSSQQMQVSPQQDFPAAGFCLIPSSSQVFCPVFLARWLHLTHGVSSLGFFGLQRGLVVFPPSLCFPDGTPRFVKSLYGAKATTGGWEERSAGIFPLCPTGDPAQDYPRSVLG